MSNHQAGLWALIFLAILKCATGPIICSLTGISESSARQQNQATYILAGRSTRTWYPIIRNYAIRVKDEQTGPFDRTSPNINHQHRARYSTLGPCNRSKTMGDGLKYQAFPAMTTTESRLSRPKRSFADFDEPDPSPLQLGTAKRLRIEIVEAEQAAKV